LLHFSPRPSFIAEKVEEVAAGPRSKAKSYVTAAVGFALVLCATLASAGAGPHIAAASIAAAVAPVSAEALALTTQIASLQADLANITGNYPTLI
jgi:hypothetical protein